MPDLTIDELILLFPRDVGCILAMHVLCYTRGYGAGPDRWFWFHFPTKY